MAAAPPIATATITTSTASTSTPARIYAGVLRYADPKDLPSYPTLGVRNDEAAASAAASLGWANRKPVEIWKPDPSASASTAAFLAKDFKMAPSWEPSRGYDPKSPGAQAALLATQSSSRARAAAAAAATPASQPRSNGHASSASMSAVYASRLSQNSPQQPGDQSRTNGSLAAAKDAMAAAASSRPRPRSTSTPQPLQRDAAARRREPNSSENDALSAAATAHRPSSSSVVPIPIEEAGAVPYTTMSRKMFTATPPIQSDIDEQKRSDMLHASAVAMARTMYRQQQRMVDATQDAAARQRELSSSKSESQLKSAAAANLQDAAYKAAQDRLNKLHEEHQKSKGYQEYYADPNAAPPPPPAGRRATNVLSKLRRRASSDGDLDRQQSERIRQQMSLFSSNLSRVDEQKRARDREALMAVAQRNVRARLQGMDQKVFEDTGKVAPSVRGEWESRAAAAAKARHEARADPNHGKVDVGGGRFVDAEEINAIAARRLKPMLDEIDEMAARERERQELLQLEAEDRREAAEREKAKEQEVRAIHKKLVEQDRQELKEKRQLEKEEEKTRRDEEKAAKATEKKRAREEKRKSREKVVKRPEEISVPERPDDAAQRPAETALDASAMPPDTIGGAATTLSKRETLSPPTSPTSPASKMKGWFKARLSRPRRKSAGDHHDHDDDGTAAATTRQPGFIGGIALRQEAGRSTSSLDHRSSSMRDVALAGKEPEPEPSFVIIPGPPMPPLPKTDRPAGRLDVPAPPLPRGASPRRNVGGEGVSLGGSDAEDDRYDEALDHGLGELSPPRALQGFGKAKSASPTRDSRFREMVD